MRRPAAAVLAAVVALLLFANPAQARDCPQDVSAQAAIVIEVSTGIVACERQADKRLSIAGAQGVVHAPIGRRVGIEVVVLRRQERVRPS